MMGVSSLIPGLMPSVWTMGSDAPKMTIVRVGFIPLTDCAPLVIATLKGSDKKYGVTLVPTKEASQAVVRNKLVSGEPDAAHILYGLLYSLELGIASRAQLMVNLMTLNQNEQAITLSATLLEQGITDVSALKKLIAPQTPGTYTFAHAFPTGTYTMWLYYWLASADINPLTDVRTVVVPLPQMVMNMRIGSMSSFCVDEPWNAWIISDRIGFTAATPQDIWPDHPEKVLGTRREWVEKCPHTARALVSTLLEASRWIDASEANKREIAQTPACWAWLSIKEGYLTAKTLGEYNNGTGRR